ncbi:MAG: hypothetical protein K8F59_10990 [Rhodobacteraceae bacterium]|nr:hypothetical protein [Paracoccaceae bacterium]
MRQRLGVAAIVLQQGHVQQLDFRIVRKCPLRLIGKNKRSRVLSRDRQPRCRQDTGGRSRQPGLRDRCKKRFHLSKVVPVQKKPAKERQLPRCADFADQNVGKPGGLAPAALTDKVPEPLKVRVGHHSGRTLGIGLPA